MQRDGEASVEEILESIKKVIARDNRETALAERRKRETTGLTEEAAAQPEPKPQAETPDEDEVLDLGEAGEMVSPDDERDEPEAELISAEVRSAMEENFAALSMLAEPPARPQIVRSGETSLEGLVRDMLRPMLAEWLDRNLPGIVETMVAKEIARIAGKRG